MIKIWTERAVPPMIVADLLRVAEHIGAGTDHPEDRLRGIEQAQGIIASATISYDAALFEKVPHLKVISRTGIGIDNIVVADATERGIAVCSTPDGPTVSTAEHTITLLLCVAKQVKRIETALKDRRTNDFITYHQGMEVDGRTLGLIGLGRIGKRVASIAQALGMKVIAYDPFVDDNQMGQLGLVPVASIEAALAEADIVSLHLPLTPDTRHLMNAERFALMKQGALFINAARGGLVDEKALAAALDSVHIAGAGIDVFSIEPPPVGHPLLDRENVIATPHIAGITRASRERMWRMAIDNAIKVINGQRPSSIVNPEVLGR